MQNCTARYLISHRPSHNVGLVRASFPDNSSYSFHRIALRLGGQSDYDVVQPILCQMVIESLCFLTIFLDLTLFPDNFSYSFHPAELEHGGS